MDTADWQTLLSDQHHNREALEEYKRVADARPQLSGRVLQHGRHAGRLKLYDDAIASLLKQRQIADDADNENLLAEVYEAKGNEERSLDAREKAAQFKAAH